jgi:DNA-binding FadR family transcriptional regulator
MAIKRAHNFKIIDNSNEMLKELIDTEVLQHFIDVLVARKAIEVEAARLAAQNISNKELQKLEKLENQRLKDYEEQFKSNPEIDIEFHRTIAQACKNEALIILSEMIIVLGQQSMLFDEMRKRMFKPYFISHEKIIKALKRHNKRET